MITFIFFLLGFVAFGWAGFKSFYWFAGLFFPEPKETPFVFITHNTHNHKHEHKHITVIDEQTKKAVLNLKK